MKANDVLRIGGASAFWGDSSLGIRQLLDSEQVDVLVFDYLAELTLSIMASARARDPDKGYATDFVTAVGPLLQEIKRKNIRLLSNAGGMNARACAQALRTIAEKAGLALKIVVVEGDDLMSMQEEIRASGVTEMFSGEALPVGLTSLNAYLGAFPIVRAIENGADIVITGRCADSALALAALVHKFGWQPDDYDRLAAGSLVGHLLECTTQATGGLFTDWWRVSNWENVGFPIAECSSDGSFMLTKPRNTGGLISRLSAAEQTLYEVTDPANYLLPDVACDFTAVTIDQVDADRVRIAGARGGPPTDTYKVSGTWLDGYRLSSTLTIVGDHAVDKAKRLSAAILGRTAKLMNDAGFDDYKDTCCEIIGSELGSYGAVAKPDAREVVLRIAVRHDKAEALNILSREIAPFGTSAAAGTTGFSGRQKPSAVFRLFSFLWPKSRVSISLAGPDGESIPVSLPEPKGIYEKANGDVYHDIGELGGEVRTVPLSSIAVARSGDKGDVAHLCLIARKPMFSACIDQQLTAAVVKKYFEHLVEGTVTRYDVPGISAYNYIMTRALGGGGAASLRNDPLGKTFGQILLSHPVQVPESWLPELDSGYPN